MVEFGRATIVKTDMMTPGTVYCIFFTFSSRTHTHKKWMSSIKLQFLPCNPPGSILPRLSFCFSWRLSGGFISPVIYLIFSPPPSFSLSRGGKLQGRQSPGPGSGLAGASYPVIYPGQAHPCFVSALKACQSGSWRLIEPPARRCRLHFPWIADDDNYDRIKWRIGGSYKSYFSVCFFFFTFAVITIMWVCNRCM